MSWIAELLVQGFWEGIVEAAYRKRGWFAGVIAFLLPPILSVTMIWVLVH